MALTNGKVVECAQYKVKCLLMGWLQGKCQKLSWQALRKLKTEDFSSLAFGQKLYQEFQSNNFLHPHSLYTMFWCIFRKHERNYKDSSSIYSSLLPAFFFVRIATWPSKNYGCSWELFAYILFWVHYETGKVEVIDEDCCDKFSSKL